MERLTRVIKGYGNDVIVYTQGKYTDTTSGEMSYKDVRNVMKHLCDYENTGLTPQEIMELKERDTAKNPVPSQFKSEMVCPVCGSTAYPWNTFCDECGQRLWDDEKP